MIAYLLRSLLLALVVWCASCSGGGKDQQDQATGALQSNASAGADTAAALDEKLHELGAVTDLIVAEANDLPRAEFDPDALSDSLGKDPQKLFEWVRDRTWWAPYRGLLRGAKGVMLDRVGSSLDRTVLLGDLLRRAGYTVRLAHTQLPENRAQELLAKVRPIPDQRRSPTVPLAASPERQRTIEAIMPGFEKAEQDDIAGTKRYADEARLLVRSQTDQLFAAVNGIAARGEATNRAAIVALQDHWWIERDDQGRWIAMDVLLPDAKPGDPVAAATTTSEWKTGSDSPSIPDADWQTVQIRVVVERYQSGAITESTALEKILRPADVLEQPITLTHTPRPWPAEIPEGKPDPNALKNAALWVNKWIPILKVGDEFVAQSAFTDGGDLTAISKDSAAGLGSSSRGGLGDFGSALGGGEEASSYATAEWIDYEIHVPGEPAQHLRRPVFDLLGPARRSTHAAGFEADTDAVKLERFEALWSSTDILLQPCDFTREFVTHLLFSRVVANQASVKELSRERDLEKARNLASTIIDRVAVWGPLPDFALWRSDLGRQPDDRFIDRPNVLNYRFGESVANADQVALRELIDVASNSTGVRRGAGKGSFQVRVEQGVADTVAEMLTLRNDLRTADNTASILAAPDSGAASRLLIAARDTAAATRLGWSADVTVRLEQDIGEGFMAVVPKQPVVRAGQQRVGWWRVHPVSGETIGVMDTGFHQDDSEYPPMNDAKAMREWLTKNGPKNRDMVKGIRTRDQKFMNKFMEILKECLKLENPGPKLPPGP